MKKLVFVVLVLVTIQVTAQNQSELKTHYEAYYKQMRMQGDIRGAINALTHLNILAPSQATKDTLAYLYANSSQYRQAINVLGPKQNTSDSNLALQVKAVSFKSLNQPQLAIENYKILYSRNPNSHLAYELADLNLQVGNAEESKTYIDFGLNNLTDKDVMSYYETNPPYQVPLKAAFLYLKGLYQYNQDQKNIDVAVATMDEAIALAPNFVLAKQIKEALLRQKEGQ